jgi:hypothetical protein
MGGIQRAEISEVDNEHYGTILDLAPLTLLEWMTEMFNKVVRVGRTIRFGKSLALK